MVQFVAVCRLCWYWMQGAHSSETLVFIYPTIRCHNQNSHCRYIVHKSVTNLQTDSGRNAAQNSPIRKGVRGGAVDWGTAGRLRVRFPMV